MKRGGNYIFFVTIIFILLFGAFTLIKDPLDRSESENRKLTKIPQLTTASFIDGSFQDAFESAMSDQFPDSSSIRVNYKQAMSSLPKFGLDKMVCQDRYLELYNSKDRRRAIYNCEDYIVYPPDGLTDEQQTIVKQNIPKYNRLNTLGDIYYYFVNDSSVMDFTTNQKAIDYTKILKENLKGKYHLASFEYKDFNDYKKWFYRTDHHWNYQGSYRGYQEIAKLLKISNVLKPKSNHTVEYPFFGSHARNTKNYSYHDEFSFYTFDFPKHDVLINQKPDSYGHIKECQNSEYNYEKRKLSQYSVCYGNDFGEIIYDFHQPKKENLLIIGNSYSNPINALIAANYNKTFIVDLRHFKDTYGYDFNFENYTKEHSVKKTLIIFSPTFIFNENTHQGLES